MIEVNYSKFRNVLEMKGHANSNENGKDLICGSATTLMYTLHDMLIKWNISADTELDDLSGYAKISAHPKAAEEHDCRIIFKTICTGLSELADAYPEYIHYKESEG